MKAHSNPPRQRWMVLLCLASMALPAGAYNRRTDSRSDTSRSHGTEEKMNELTTDAARAALLLMIQAAPDDSPVRHTVDAVRSHPPRSLSDGGVAIGPWECDLTRHTFVFAIANPPVFFQQTAISRRRLLAGRLWSQRPRKTDRTVWKGRVRIYVPPFGLPPVLKQRAQERHAPG